MAAPLSDTELLAKSCMEASQYPKNLIRPGIPQHHLEAYHDRLIQHSPRLFSSDGDSALHIWDYDNDASEFRPTVASSAIQLRARIEGSHLFSHADPKCRFLFIHAPKSRAPLKTSQEMLAAILTRYQVMPAFLDFIFPFGHQEYLQDFYFSGFRAEARLSASTEGPKIPILGRSGRDLRLCYNLKSVETSKNTTSSSWPWSVRQTAVYHSFDVLTGSAAWIIVKGNQVIQDRIQAATSKGFDGLPDLKSFDTLAASFASTLATHLTVVEWCGEDWRWYLHFLESTLQDATRRSPKILTGHEARLEEDSSTDTSLNADSNPREPRSLLRSIANFTNRTNHPPSISITAPSTPENVEGETAYTFKTIERVQDLEEKANEVKSVLNANIDILTELRLFYQSTTQSPSFTPGLNLSCSMQLSCFEERISNVLIDLQRQKSRAQTLQHLLGDRKALLYGIFNRKSIESSKLLSEKAAASTQRMETMTEAMHQIAVKTQQETVSMRIVTLVTLFFLPGTFISTFMSTDIISFLPSPSTTTTNEPGGGEPQSFRLGALKLYLELTVPCMALTFAAWWGMYLWARRKERLALMSRDGGGLA